MNTMDFNTLIKKVHPDLNPNIEDAGSKISEVMKNRNNPNMLFYLAQKWGLVGGNKKSEKEDVNDGFVIGNMFLFDGKFYGVVVEVTDGQGRRKGQKKVYCVKQGTNRIIYFFVPHENYKLNNITYQAKASPSLMSKVNKVYLSYIQQKENFKQAKDNYKKQKEESVQEELRPNTKYWDSGVYIYTRTKGGPYRVTRTTSKMVFYYDEREGKERSVRMSSVTRVFNG